MILGRRVKAQISIANRQMGKLQTSDFIIQVDNLFVDEVGYYFWMERRSLHKFQSAAVQLECLLSLIGHPHNAQCARLLVSGDWTLQPALQEILSVQLSHCT